MRWAHWKTTKCMSIMKLTQRNELSQTWEHRHLRHPRTWYELLDVVIVAFVATHFGQEVVSFLYAVVDLWWEKNADAATVDRHGNRSWCFKKKVDCEETRKKERKNGKERRRETLVADVIITSFFPCWLKSHCHTLQLHRLGEDDKGATPNSRSEAIDSAKPKICQIR